ncbi:MAG: S8/S53 family peptidase [Actinobacteria bacterium]|nr:S8/S53 family peptidase [Actinomycetota bacterium]
MHEYQPAEHRPLAGTERHPALGAVRQGPSPAEEEIQVSVRLRRRPDAGPLPDLDTLRDRRPGSPAPVSREEFAERYGADPADIDRVRAFAESFGLTVDDASVARRTVQLSGTSAQLARAFRTELGSYRLPDGSSYRGREGAVQLPEDLHAVVEGVFGLDDRPQARPLNVRAAAAGHGPAQGVTALTPPQAAALYGFPTTSAAGQTIGLLEFGGGYRMPDLRAFFHGVDRPLPRVVPVGVDGATNSPGSEADGEVVLDIDVAGSVAPGADIAVYFAPWTERGWIDAVTTAVHDTDNRPSVLSISWGWPEFASVDGLTWTRAAIEAVSATFHEAAALGMTVLAASGDTGTYCYIDDHRAHVLYPASDPYVLCCGGTRISDVAGSSFTETTWSHSFGTTGGGVSDVFAKPVWQQWAGVPLNVNDRHVGRGIPDVAGNADPASGYSLVLNGVATSPIGGTSAVAPLYAGLVAILNADLGEPVGYLNPNLYMFANSPVFRDDADGATNATNGAPGYHAVPGWDACTGFGSIRGEELLLALRGVGEPPALAQFGDALYLAWKGVERDDRMFFSRYSGDRWAAQSQIPGVGSSAGPALVLHQGKLFAAWKGVLGDEGIYWSTYDGTAWAPQRTDQSIGTSTGVSLAVLNGVLYLAWKGVEGDQRIFWRTFDGNHWTPQQIIPGVASSHGPSLAVYRGRLYASWKGMWDDQGIYWSSFDGTAWAPQRRVGGVGTSSGPSLVPVGAVLLAAWKGISGDQGIYWSTFDGISWAPQRQVAGVGSSLGPGLGSFNGTAVMAWKGIWGDQGIYFSSLAGTVWSPQRVVPGVGTSPDLLVGTG